ncbi:hypothetical protein ACET3Z_002277 [Daucus carota]
MDKQKIARLSEESEDRISWLSNDLIHEILSFVDAKSAVQTSVLSKRWKLVWTTLPYVNFTNYIFPQSELHILETRSRFISNFFLSRNILSGLLKVNFEFDDVAEQLLFPQYMFEAMFNNARDIKFETSASGFKLDSCIYSMNSPSLHKLTLRPIQGELSATRCWNLPALTTLNLAAQPDHRILLPELHLLCLPALRTLVLEGFQLPDPISLPALTTLHLTNCILPQNSWDFPALLTLKLDAVSFPESRFFSALVNLKNLILFFRGNITKECLISCPQLENLGINSPVSTTTYHSGNIIVLAHHIRKFTSVGFFPIVFGVSELENVNIKLRGSNGDEHLASLEEFKLYYTRVVYMFPGLSNAKILTLDSATVQALSAVSKLLVQVPSPFYQLKHVKVPHGHKDSSISADLKRYLLGRSPEATIVTKLPQILCMLSFVTSYNPESATFNNYESHLYLPEFKQQEGNFNWQHCGDSRAYIDYDNIYIYGDILGATELQSPTKYSSNDSKLAAKNFSIVNKLGKGGYGDVYKGTLKNGDIVAVKRTALDARVAETIFDSEVRLISNVHHRNLIRLLGCCIKGQELLLVIEYMANSSLEKFLYDPDEYRVEDVKKCMEIGLLWTQSPVSSRPPMSQVVAMLLIGNTSEDA